MVSESAEWMEKENTKANEKNLDNLSLAPDNCQCIQFLDRYPWNCDGRDCHFQPFLCHTFWDLLLFWEGQEAGEKGFPEEES